MSIVPKGYNVVSKLALYPSFPSYIEFYYNSDPQLNAICHMIMEKDPTIHCKTYAMYRYYAPLVIDLYVRENDVKLVTPNNSTTAINIKENRLCFKLPRTLGNLIFIVRLSL